MSEFGELWKQQNNPACTTNDSNCQLCGRWSLTEDDEEGTNEQGRKAAPYRGLVVVAVPTRWEPCGEVAELKRRGASEGKIPSVWTTMQLRRSEMKSVPSLTTTHRELSGYKSS